MSCLLAWRQRHSLVMGVHCFLFRFLHRFLFSSIMYSLYNGIFPFDFL